MTRHVLACLLLCFITTLSHAQGIRGTIKTTDGKELPYAAVIVKNSTKGTISNSEGRYELPLEAGRYDIVFQYLGFQTQQKSVEIKSTFETIDVTMTEVAIRLQEVQTRSTNEDPAYTIMRRAIAKSKYHQLQVNSYTARVYGKGSFTVESIPKLIEKMAGKQLKEAEQENNFKVGVPNVFESVSEITFQQPNSYRRRLIASRNSQSDELIPANFSMGSFYRPEINNAVSPLSPKAFAYYKFTYEGTFRESAGGQPVEISKIRVTPRSWGEGVFRGVIYIIENTWALHSLQLEQVMQQGITVNLRQTYTPIQNVWMPVNGRFSVRGALFGVRGSGEAVMSYQYRNLKVNPAFVEDVQVVDEKKFKPDATLSKREVKGQSLDDLVKKQKEFSTKNLRQMMKEYEKQEAKARKEKARQENKEEVEVLRNDSTSIDSLAGKRSVAFWDSLRSVPLTSAEIRSYVRNDSLKIVREVKAKTDSVKVAKKDSTKGSSSVKLSQVWEGATWRLANRITLRYDSPLSDPSSNFGYNTVEGYWLKGGLRLNIRGGAVDTTGRPSVGRPSGKNKKRPEYLPGPTWSVGGVARYRFAGPGFNWNRLIGYGLAQYAFKNTVVGVQAGRYVSQLNPDNPISNGLNTLTTLLFEQNFLKQYQKDFARLSVDLKPWKERVTFSGYVEYAERFELANFREDIRPWINWRSRAFTPNRVANDEVGSSAFPVHQAFVLNLTASARLGAPRYYIRNGKRYSRPNNDAPWLSLNYRKGIAGIGRSDTDYDFLQARISHSFETGIRSRLSYNVSAGVFVNDRAVFFPDFRHFAGNEFFLQQGDPVSVFRLLPYYRLSTGKRFLEAHALAEYRKFLLTQITWLRLLDLKENLFVHYLATPASRHYTEVGYGLNGLIPKVFPFFRLEVIGQFQDWQYKGLGFRVGTTLNFGR